MFATIPELILEDRKITCFVADTSLQVTAVAGYQAQTEYKEVLGQSLLTLSPEMVGSESVLEELLAGSLPRFELPLVNREQPDGQVLYLSMIYLPHHNASGQIDGLMQLTQDTTARGILEQEITQQRNELRLLQTKLSRQNVELAAYNAELRHLDELKSTFVSVAAHELRSPLSALYGYLKLLLDEEDGDPLTNMQRTFLNIMDNSVSRLLTIINDLLDVTKIEAGRLDLILKPESLAEMIKTVALELKPQLDAANQQLSLALAPNLPPALCDRVRTMQIIGNLLNNASKYTLPGGKIKISAGPAPESGFSQVAVQDTGVGISKEDQEKLFNRFFRAGSASLTESSGAGLGLHITRNLVEMHGGRIWFESKLNQGSSFYVTFPLADDQSHRGE